MIKLCVPLIFGGCLVFTAQVPYLFSQTPEQQNPPLPEPALPKNVDRIATILKVHEQVSLLALFPNQKVGPATSSNKEMIQHMESLQQLQLNPGANTATAAQILAGQELLQAQMQVNVAAIQAIADINRAMMILQRKTQTITITDEEKAYRNTKFVNAFLGTSIGMVGSGLQFSKNQTVNYVGDGISVAGGAVTAAFNLCTADVDVRDSPPDFADYFDQLPTSIKTYLQQTDPQTYTVLEAPPKKVHSGMFSCHFHGAPRPPSSGKTEILTKQLANMSDDVNAMLEEIQNAQQAQ